MRRNISLIIKKILDYCVYFPILYLGGIKYALRSRLTKENPECLVDCLLVPKLIKISCFIGRVVDKIDGESEHEKIIREDWNEYLNEKEKCNG